jgi:hypothetical protein
MNDYTHDPLKPILKNYEPALLFEGFCADSPKFLIQDNFGKNMTRDSCDELCKNTTDCEVFGIGKSVGKFEGNCLLFKAGC